MSRLISTCVLLFLLSLFTLPAVAQMEMAELNQLYIRQNENRVSRMIRLSQKDPEMFSRRTCISSVNPEIGSEVGFTPIVQRISHYDFQTSDQTSISAEFLSYTAIQRHKPQQVASFGQELPYFAGVITEEYRFSGVHALKRQPAIILKETAFEYGVLPEVPHFANRGIHRIVVAKIGGEMPSFVDYDFVTRDGTSIAAEFVSYTGVTSEKIKFTTIGQPLPHYAGVQAEEYVVSSRSALRLQVASQQIFQRNYVSFTFPVCRLMTEWDPRDLIIDNTVIGDRMKKEADQINLDFENARGQLMELMNR